MKEGKGTKPYTMCHLFLHSRDGVDACTVPKALELRAVWFLDGKIAYIPFIRQLKGEGAGGGRERGSKTSEWAVN